MKLSEMFSQRDGSGNHGHVKLKDGCEAIYVHLPVDLIRDDYPLTIVLFEPEGSYMTTRCVSRAELEATDCRSWDDLDLFEFGTDMGDVLPWDGKQPKPAPPEQKESTEALQTEKEVAFATSPQLIKALNRQALDVEKIGCSAKPVDVSFLSWPVHRVINGQVYAVEVPRMMHINKCTGYGFYDTITQEFPVEGDPLSGRRVCAETWNYHQHREISIKEVRRTTAVSFTLGITPPEIGLDFDLGSAFTPKEKEPVYAFGKRKLDAKGEGINFDFKLRQEYARLKVRAIHDVLVKRERIKCRPELPEV